jgi:DNA-binding CsgD family transcriptional regulator
VIPSVLDMLPMGILVIAETGRVIASNRAGRFALDHGGAINESHGIVTLSSETHNHMLQDLLDRARAGDRSQAALRVPRESRKPLLILFVPVEEDFARESHDNPLALLIMNGPTHEPDAALLTDFFGFSAAEARVASFLMQGKTVVDVAKALDIEQSTTRNHLKHMYSKTATRKQSELVHALLTSPAGLVFSSASGRETPEPPRRHRSRTATSH